MASRQDPTQEILAGNYPNCRILVSTENLGFAAGNNWGMRQAKGEYFFIVNNDTELSPSILQDLLNPLLKDKSIGVVSPRINFFSAPSIIQYAGFQPMNRYTGRTHSIGLGETDKGQFLTGRETASAHGCAMMVPRKIADITGMFPELFFLYYEEWDWCARIRKAGYKVWFEGQGMILHKDSLTVGRKSLLQVYYQTRNRILFMRRNSSNIELCLFLLHFILLSTPKAIIEYLAKGDVQSLKKFLAGAVWNLHNSSASKI